MAELRKRQRATSKNAQEPSPDELERRAQVRAARQQKKDTLAATRGQDLVENGASKVGAAGIAAPAKTIPARMMLPVKGHIISPPSRTAPPLRTLTIMTYNILAQCLCRRELFPYCKKEHLKYKARVPRVLYEITQDLKPDVACLQEVDNFDEMVKPVLEREGYDWEYLRKVKEKENGHGLCIIWKKSIFYKHASQSLFYDTSPLTHPTTLTPLTNNIAQLLALKLHRPAGGVGGILLSNTHLFWKPFFRYERSRQGWVLMDAVERFRRELVGAGGKWPGFVCGDFNTLPNDGLYRALTKQPLTVQQIADLEPLTTSSPPPANPAPVSPPSPTSPPSDPTPSQILTNLSHLPTLHSAYSTYRAIHPTHPGYSPVLSPDAANTADHASAQVEWDEPPYTNYAAWKGTLDYIFLVGEGGGGAEEGAGGEGIGETRVEVESVLEIPPPALLEPGLPNDHFGSDHVALMAKVTLY
ncbi:Endonuclease/exonuclease/phosphatase [Fimicolochytrium jonesii]|uniref:Endonuclease/exonuclease/phosphatase n=1 Tax=Fimicolochytrium jonesii TaxID=1396493 RepID=UPI0022FED502|nr:Endonuclease/exonuclease/phosphatase [Fimicolochytrium jonesii]KAI8820729.1 Endonuclease/exonuclease/phosphatase [Fimicolochytrium jonesii]